MKLKLQEAKNFLYNPKRIEIFVKEWEGNIVLRSITVAEHSEMLNINDQVEFRKRLFTKTIIEPLFDDKNIDILLSKSFSTLQYIYEAALIVNCLHPKIEHAVRAALEDNYTLYNKFMISEQTKIPVWSYGKGIDDWYIMEYYMYMFYRIVSKEREAKGTISGNEIQKGRGKSTIIKKVI